MDKQGKVIQTMVLSNNISIVSKAELLDVNLQCMVRNIHAGQSMTRVKGIRVTVS